MNNFKQPRKLWVGLVRAADLELAKQDPEQVALVDATFDLTNQARHPAPGAYQPSCAICDTQFSAPDLPVDFLFSAPFTDADEETILSPFYVAGVCSACSSFEDQYLVDTSSDRIKEALADDDFPTFPIGGRA